VTRLEGKKESNRHGPNSPTPGPCKRSTALSRATCALLPNTPSLPARHEPIHTLILSVNIPRLRVSVLQMSYSPLLGFVNDSRRIVLNWSFVTTPAFPLPLSTYKLFKLLLRYFGTCSSCPDVGSTVHALCLHWLSRLRRVTTHVRGSPLEWAGRRRVSHRPSGRLLNGASGFASMWLARSRPAPRHAAPRRRSRPHVFVIRRILRNWPTSVLAARVCHELDSISLKVHFLAQ